MSSQELLHVDVSSSSAAAGRRRFSGRPDIMVDSTTRLDSEQVK
eukprot:CAMPEP_0178673964 /NCGR_PEP_ID=MMETSP0698-20121128/34598_1 /TAXON_ID=265572 /ORGANISM="Extubocellulus spinifer, Strain CCMP396" /LENGTH=43 /DNA_ID= /DNA_START= /DNA_END= /DNA_ORIENTATION=